MSDTTIEWTDEVWNPVTGCTKVSAGCKNCYAERVFPRAYGNSWVPAPGCLHPHGGPDTRTRRFTDVLTHPDRLDQPLRWRKPRRVFVNSMSDLFHEAVPDAFKLKVFSVMAAAEQHTFQILTKRPKRMLMFIAEHKRYLSNLAEFWPIPNVWLGVSVEDQNTADERVPLLLQTPAAIRFASYEPALGPIDFNDLKDGETFWTRPAATIENKLDWIIVGGESGPGARPFNIQWARDVIRQCKAAGVAVFVKQLGANPQGPYDPTLDVDWTLVERKENPLYEMGLIDRKGGAMNEWPADLRVREFPSGALHAATR